MGNPSGPHGTNAPQVDIGTSGDWGNQLDGHHSTTALGDALREVSNRKRGQPLAGIFVITDGANNSGSPPLEAADRLRSEGVPLYIYGVGLTAPRDIIVGNLLAPEVTFVQEELDVTVRVRGQGLAGQTATLKLQLGDQVLEKPITFSANVEQVVVFTITPQKEGAYFERSKVALDQLRATGRFTPDPNGLKN